VSKKFKIKIYRTSIFRLVLYGFVSWFPREEYRLKVYENRALTRIFGSMRDEIIGWRIKLHNDELYNLYSSPNIYNHNAEVKDEEMGRTCSTHEE
jgi:hypothetical protein